jgi:uncharacterized membrane protein YfcA
MRRGSEGRWLHALVTATTTVGVAGGLVQLVRADRRTVLRWTVVVIVAAVVVRVGWAAWIAHAEPEAVRTPDTPGYLEPAWALLRTPGGLGLLGSRRRRPRPTIRRSGS